jgi:hypothetical protein
MTNFYIARDGNRVASWIAADEAEGAHRIFVWLANDQSWHHNSGLEKEFYSLTPDMDEAARQVLTWPKLDPELAGWVIESLAAAPRLTVN